ncbi:MAG: response regulator [Pseudanabaena sp. M114S2SP2A07QC]|nr:response regulator [Pseudanabaena sp. M090S1SP2A07QC]MCA6505178.1 response regulator [Pseudanabaena sp. M172S2SP2A07QC]MCA6521147.1 response regulator [Pseudanabaena sp. M051S1SP2A07QC]MCA6525441.1 response regulator [Pseudanabaena sp. M179S2SP2A07QC]MCA6535880.1 response regulator [Pseudanabaena sp. M176S2SP2A07QC]MCA6558121.1 response regulator [Pseudanabaena sp. M114S2SP2A07QC]MCA6561604.1 response regulator [Pseudanabaena sp. M079S1SP2A07QC]MCA6565056.1 response regulator [Pseudanabae
MLLTRLALVNTSIQLQPKFIQDLKQLHVLFQQATGELLVTGDQETDPAWNIYFYLGRLVYATGGKHRVRRLARAIRQHSPNVNIQDLLEHAKPNAEAWELKIIEQAIHENLLTTEQARAIIQSSIHEVFYSLSDQKNPKSSWKPLEALAFKPIVALSTTQTLDSIVVAQSRWQQAGLSHVQNMIQGFSFDLAPYLANPDQLALMLNADVITLKTYKTLKKIVNGKNTLWDLSIIMKRSMIAVMRSLLPLVVDGIVAFREIPDWISPDWKLPGKPSNGSLRGLVACIDDSPQVAVEMKRILEPLGYEVLGITEPLQSVSTLLQRKPDLIFLDLVMPNTNGYELCTFLRKTTTFQEIPIVILTGRDGMIDRVRAKMAGSSDFLSKPPDAAKVLQILHKFLQIPKPN